MKKLIKRLICLFRGRHRFEGISYGYNPRGRTYIIRARCMDCGYETDIDLYEEIMRIAKVHLGR